MCIEAPHIAGLFWRLLEVLVSLSPINYEKTSDGEIVACGTIISDGILKFSLGLAVCVSKKVCAVFRGGWEVQHLLGYLDGQNYKLTVMKRGMFFTKVYLEWGQEKTFFKTANSFGDLLRSVYGDELLK